jgi:PAS domain S-box-containing protein
MSPRRSRGLARAFGLLVQRRVAAAGGWRLSLLIGAPVVVAGLGLRGLHAGLYDAEHGLALSATLVGVLAISLALWVARAPLASAVRDSEARLRAFKRAVDQLHLMVESGTTGMIIVNRAGEIVRVNSVVETMFGYGREQLVGRAIETLLPERYRARHTPLRSTYFLDPHFRASRIDGELFGLHRDGHEVPVEIGLTPVPGLGDLVLATVIDITERTRTERALRESEEQLRIAQHATGIGTFDWVIDGDTVSWSPALEAMYGLPPGGFRGGLRAWNALVHPDDRGETVRKLHSSIASGLMTEAEWRAVWPDGTIRWLAARWKVFKDAAGRPLRVRGVNIDVTERKQAEREREILMTQLGALNDELEDRVQARTAQLSAMLREREVLLQEVHHRVKNNLQVISSLISLQIRRVEDRANRSGLEQCKTRVEAIALIHEKLYQSSDYARVPFADYARSLVGNIFQAGGASSTNIRLSVDIATIALPVDKAIPCGLILNELITNALKHAFPGERRGSVRVALHRASPAGLVLAVSDDGVGMVPGPAHETAGSLGMQLIATLVDQLGGTLEIASQGGTSVRIAFPFVDDPEPASARAG